MFSLSIDSGRRSGYSVIEIVTGKLIAYGSWINEGKTHGDIYCSFHNKLQELIHEYRPSVLVCEKQNVTGGKFGGDNVIYLAGYKGIEHLLASVNNIEHVVVNPMSVKKYITGNGRAEKENVLECLSKHYKVHKEYLCDCEHYKKTGLLKTVHYEKSDSIANNRFYCEVLVNENIK